MRETFGEPKYRHISARKLQKLERTAQAVLAACTLCPRSCRVNRHAGQRGFCGAGAAAEVAHWQVHFGEEPPLADHGGAGAIFFARCTLACVFCQNFQISQTAQKVTVLSANDLAAVMVDLQRQGSQNIDLVSPTHMVPQIIAAVRIAREKGLRVPLVYNTNGYESPDTLRLLEALVDIYVPDVKFGDDRFAQQYCGVCDYTHWAELALAEMIRQCGPLRVDTQGRAVRGVMVRHLVLPHDQAATAAVCDMLARCGTEQIGLSVMSQYAPCHRAAEYPLLDRRLTRQEYAAAVARAEELDTAYCWVQELDSNRVYFPDFERPRVFSPGSQKER